MKLTLYVSLFLAFAVAHLTHDANAEGLTKNTGCKAPICYTIGK